MKKVYELTLTQNCFRDFESISIDIKHIEYWAYYVATFLMKDFHQGEEGGSFQLYKTRREALKDIAQYIKDPSQFNKQGKESLREFADEIEEVWSEMLI